MWIKNNQNLQFYGREAYQRGISSVSLQNGDYVGMTGVNCPFEVCRVILPAVDNPIPAWGQVHQGDVKKTSYNRNVGREYV